jgi:predicted metal-dependent phosphoesterase TrpH
LHSHCNLDPWDYRGCAYSAEALIRSAARHGYQVLAITCHNLDVWTPELSACAAELGITLIPGMEVSVEGGRHTLVYNFKTGAKNLNTLDKIRGLVRTDTLVVAPHPYYPSPRCHGRNLDRNSDVFDAVEISGFYVPGLDFNRRARRTAERLGKPLIGNGDIHQLWQLGRTFTWIQAESNPSSIIASIKEGRTRVESKPLSYAKAAEWWATALWRYVLPHSKPVRPKTAVSREYGSQET